MLLARMMHFVELRFVRECLKRLTILLQVPGPCGCPETGKGTLPRFDGKYLLCTVVRENKQRPVH